MNDTTFQQSPRSPLHLACEAVLFDCDGVLVDSRAAGERAWSQWASEYGLDPVRVLDGVHGRRSAETVALFLPEPEQEQAIARIEAIEIAGAAMTTPLGGARELLAGLPKAWAIVTSASRSLLLARLTAARLPVPDVVITADQVRRGKPAPDGYLEAARQLGFPPSACVVVEDSAAGIQAGRAAGCGHVLGVGALAVDLSAHSVVKDLSGVRWTGDGLEIGSAALLRAPVDTTPQHP